MPGQGSYGPAGKWIHDRAHRIMREGETQSEYGSKKGKSIAYAIATQQGHAVKKSPKDFKTPTGVQAAKRKYDEPKQMKKTASKKRKFGLPEAAMASGAAIALGGLGADVVRVAKGAKEHGGFWKSFNRGGSGKVLKYTMPASAALMLAGTVGRSLRKESSIPKETIERALKRTGHKIHGGRNEVPGYGAVYFDFFKPEAFDKPGKRMKPGTFPKAASVVGTNNGVGIQGDVRLRLASLVRGGAELEKMALEMEIQKATPMVSTTMTPAPQPTSSQTAVIKPAAPGMRLNQKYSISHTEAAGPTEGLGAAARNTPPPVARR